MAFIFTKAVLSRIPLQLVSTLCCLTQARQQVFLSHRGHLYFH